MDHPFQKETVMSLRMVGMVCLMLFYMVNECAAMGKNRSDERELMVDGVQRSYTMFMPNTQGKKALPLMIVLHGGLGNAEYMQRTSGMDEVAAAEQFIVAYPNGIAGRFGFKNRRTWNAGPCCGLAARTNVDDVRFIEKMIADIESKYPIDTRRIYVTGMSNGAMMAYRIAADIPGKIAAVIAVAGTMPVDNFDAAKDVAVMHIHGTDDEHVPLTGGVGDDSVSGVSHRSLADTVALIVRSRNCSPPEERTETDGVKISSYRCRSGAPVEVVLLEGAGHAWPGGTGRRAGLTHRNFSASRQAWAFAKQFSKTE